MFWKHLYWTELRATLTAKESCQLPLWKGSMLRGAFGRRLQEVKKPEMVGAVVKNVGKNVPHAYEALWISKQGERGNRPKPFILLPPECDGNQQTEFEGGKKITLGVRLIGENSIYAAQIARALLGSWNLGFQRSTWVTTDLAVRAFNSDQKYFEDQSCELDYCPVIEAEDIVEASPFQEECRLRFHVPIDLKIKGKRANQLSGSLIVRRALDRVWDFLPECGMTPDREAFKRVIPLMDSIQTRSSEWKRITWERYSSTSRGKHPLTGLLGEIELAEIPSVVWPWLVLGQYLHIGKGCSFGQGAYEVLS